MSRSKIKPEAKNTAFDYEKHAVPITQGSVRYHNILLTLVAMSVIPLYLYGVRVLLLLAFALLGAFITDFVCIKLFYRRKFIRSDCSSIVTAFIAAFLLPATAPPWLAMVSVMIGLAVAKYPFGGTNKNIFNPAAVGTAFCALCWPELVLKYPVPFTTYGFDDSAVQYAIAPASRLKMGGAPPIDYFDILLGKFTGPMGATCMIVIIACMIYLLCRKMISGRIILSSVAVVVVCALLFPRTSTSLLDSVVYELSCEAYMFGIVFMASDPATVPKTNGGKVFFGILLSALLMMMRYFGKVELHFVYALLIANVFESSCDRYAANVAGFVNKILKKVQNKETDLVKAGEQNA